MTESNRLTFEAIAEAAAALGALGFIVSVIYDWGFFRALNLDFSYVPTTTADHFRSGLLWFPPLLALVLGYFAVEFQFQRIERGLTEEEIIQSSSNPDRLRRFREGPWKFLVWTAPLYVVMYALIGDALSSVLPWALVMLWMGFAQWCYSAPLIKQRRNKYVQLGFTLIPAFGIFAFFSGYNAAVDAAWRKPIEVTVERLQPATSISGNVLRTLDKGVLVLSNDKSIQFIPWNQVRAVVDRNAYVPFRGVLCGWFKLCPKTTVVPN